MINKVREYIQQYRLLENGNRVIVGVSGGADSMALVSILHRLKDDLGVDLVVAHLNHNLRGEESDADAALVKRAAADTGLTLFSKKVDSGEIANQGLSLEDAARKARYAFFYQLLDDLQADKIALGHQFHDQAETVMLNLLRGAGSRGLRGIVPMRDQVLVRPLLNITREEILAYLDHEKIQYREDRSNRSEVFLRNRVRHDLLPYMKKYNPRIEERLHDLAETMRTENDFLEEETVAILKLWRVALDSQEITIFLDDFLSLHEAMQRRVIKSVLESRSRERNGISQVHVNTIMGLVKEGHVGQKLSLPFRTEVFRHYDRLIFIKSNRRVSKEVAQQDLEEPSALTAEELRLSCFEYSITSIPTAIEIKESGCCLRLSTTEPLFHNLKALDAAYLDYEKIEFPLIIRNIRPGDRFRPLGMAGTKKVKSFFIDRKIPRDVRHQIPMLVDRKAILWIAGLATSDRVKVTTSTRICLKIEII